MTLFAAFILALEIVGSCIGGMALFVLFIIGCEMLDFSRRDKQWWEPLIGLGIVVLELTVAIWLLAFIFHQHEDQPNKPVPVNVENSK